MAILKFVNKKDKYKDSEAISNIMSYILDPEKSKRALYGFNHIDPENPSKSMHEVSKSFKKSIGVQLRHYILSFTKYELSEPIIVDQIARALMTYYQDEYQCAYAVHEDTEYLHIHLVCNAISYVDGHRYRGTKREYYDFISWIKRLLQKNRIYTLYVYNG